MNHYYDAMAVAQAMGKRLGGKGNVVILNAPPGIIIRDQRTNGFTDGLKKYWPKIKVVSDQNAEWDFTTMLAGNSDINGAAAQANSVAVDQAGAPHVRSLRAPRGRRRRAAAARVSTVRSSRSARS
jgi:ABC-type sugar transport system substrate-binding protein